ncbi:MAG: V-type ATP synthase subunit A [Candidatus Lokiarchaeota archaeon]|nr:V-type ATP synthase subunit A [Candidatus Lokiarchaeota archaeon]MCK4479148.1 V-type ATP synthase subunit A [Candidatus Lokiarchaeota archaeon]
MEESNKEFNTGYISAIIGSLIKIKGLENHVRLHDLVKISNYQILGEVIQIYSDYIIAQCFENTIRVKLNEEVINLKEPLSMELAPGLISNVFDGIQRPLEEVFKNFGSGGLERGIKFPPLSRTKKWHFVPLRKIEDKINSGDIIGTVQETQNFEHKIMVPPYHSGTLSFISDEGDYTIIDEIYKLKINSQEKSFSMMQKWPITVNRPYARKENPNEPLITGMRVIDLLFPIAKGGTTAIPGGFGTGKTVIQQSLAKWSNADVVVFIGCGEPGNEIANILKQFSEIINPQTGRPLLERIVLIANTSNMPVSAREASLFSGVTIAEYFRDMGYDVAVLADSTSRWAESLREISGLLEEMPAEEGYPAYLPSKLSNFYERAGVVKTLGTDHQGIGRKGSLTIIGTISPPAADFSEPVTATTKRLVQSFWALDPKLAYLKHYPAINWMNSYSNYAPLLAEWWYERDIDWPEIDIDWIECRKQVNEILSEEKELTYIIQLIGEKNLPDDQQLVLFLARLIKNGFLIQSAFDDIDNYTKIKKLLGLIKIILLIYNEGKLLIEQGILIENFLDPEIINEILRIRHSVKNDDFYLIEELKNKLLRRLRSLTI